MVFIPILDARTKCHEELTVISDVYCLTDGGINMRWKPRADRKRIAEGLERKRIANGLQKDSKRMAKG